MLPSRRLRRRGGGHGDYAEGGQRPEYYSPSRRGGGHGDYAEGGQRPEYYSPSQSTIRRPRFAKLALAVSAFLCELISGLFSPYTLSLSIHVCGAAGGGGGGLDVLIRSPAKRII